MDYQMDENTGTGLLLWDMGRSERVRQEEEQRRIHHIRMSLWRTRFITGVGMLVGLFYASGAAITYSISVKTPESTLERVLIGLAISKLLCAEFDRKDAGKTDKKITLPEVTEVLNARLLSRRY